MPSVSLHLQSRPENVALAREVLAGLAEALPLSTEQYDDMRTAVTEACNNVVQHAYSDGHGPLEMEVALAADAVLVTVRDRGIGLSGAAAQGAGEFEIGLPVILALTDRLQLGHTPEGGTEVQMRFLAPGVQPPDRPLEGAMEDQAPADDGRPDEPGAWPDAQAAAGGERVGETPELPEIVLPGAAAQVRAMFGTSELPPFILPRLAALMAARAHFSTDGVADVQLLSDELAAQAPPLANGSHLEVAFSLAPRRLELQLGPLVRGAGERLLRSAAIAALCERTSVVTPMGPDEVLLVSVADSALR